MLTQDPPHELCAEGRAILAAIDKIVAADSLGTSEQRLIVLDQIIQSTAERAAQMRQRKA